MVVLTCIFLVLVLGCLNRSYAQNEFRFSELFPRDDKTSDTRTVVHIPKPPVNKGLSKTESESVNPQNEGYILVPQVVKVPKRGSNKLSTSASKGQRPSNIKRISSIDLLSDLNLNPSKDRLFNLTRSPPRDRFTDYTGSSTRDVTADTNSNTRRNRPSDLSRSSTRDVITELNNLSARDRMSNILRKFPKISTDASVSPSQIETISQILNVPKSKILDKLPQISRIFSQAAKIPSSNRNSPSKAPQMEPMSPPIIKDNKSNSKVQLGAQKYPLVQQQSPQQQQNLRPQNFQRQNLQQKPQQQNPQQQTARLQIQQQNPQQQTARLQIQQQNPQQQTARLQIQQPEVPRLQLQQPEIPKPITQQNAEPMPAFTTNFNSPKTPDISSLPMMKAFTDGSERGMNPGQVADPMNPIDSPLDPTSMQQMPPDMPQYSSMGPPQKTFTDGSEISSGGSMSPDLTAMPPMPQMGPDMTSYSSIAQATIPQMMPTGNQMADMSFMSPPDMPPMSQGFQDTQMGMDPFGSNVDPACALGQVYATCNMVKIDEKQVYGDVDFSQQVDPMCTPIGNLMVNVKLFGFNPEDIMFEHGLHVHEYGDVRGHCTSVGPLFNPYQTTHGGRQTAVRHMGNFGNVREDAEGNVFQTFQVPGTAIIGPLTIVGKALVVKTGPDNLGVGGMAGGMPFGAPGGMSTFPAGCCVIGKSDQMRSAHIYNQMPVGNMLGIS